MYHISKAVQMVCKHICKHIFRFCVNLISNWFVKYLYIEQDFYSQATQMLINIQLDIQVLCSISFHTFFLVTDT